MSHSPGMTKVPDKMKRELRRRNHIAKDLMERKYHPRVIPKKRRDYDWTDDLDEIDDYDFDKEMGLTAKE